MISTESSNTGCLKLTAPAIILFMIGGNLGWLAGQAAARPVVEPSRTFAIIDDRSFLGGFYLHEDAIRDFLDEHGEDCEGENCLKNYRDPDTNEPAARIIAEAARDFGVSPAIILVTLQKENSLVTIADPEPWRYRTAMGYGCPDNADCDADFFGFKNQIRLGTNLLRAAFDRACGDRISHLRWRVDPRWYRGHVTSIDGRKTLIGNCATAALYNYTPHRVDSAWLPGANDGQLYYGNYNFVYFYEVWFGDSRS